MDIALEDLVSSVTKTANSPIGRLNEATGVARHLRDVGEALIDYFVRECRETGTSWAEIGEHLGVSRQAVQQRFMPIVANQRSPRHRQARTTEEHSGKYRPLWAWLKNQRSDELDLTFAEIERVLGFTLPPSSRRHPPHWHSYDGSAVARAIADAGWKARNVDVTAEHVTLVKLP